MEKRTFLLILTNCLVAVVCVFFVAGSMFCECVYECVKKVSRKSTAVHTGDRGDSRDGARNTLRNANRLDDLEDCGTAHHEDEQRQQPRSDGVLLLGVLRRFGDVSALGDVAAGLLVGHADSLLGGHCAVVCCWVTCKSLEQTGTNWALRKLLFCAELLLSESKIVQVLFSLVFVWLVDFSCPRES